MVDFAEEIGRPLDPWQRWLAIHALELLPDGRPRFRQVLVLVARQNGKTEMLVVLSLWWLVIQQVPMVLGTSTKLDYAKESWEKAIRLARGHPELKQLIPVKGGVRRTNGEQTFTLSGDGDAESPDACRYKVAASNDEGGRSLTVGRLIEDELRQHHDWSAHEAAENAMNAVGDAQAWGISNAGEERSVVLNSLSSSALEFISTGQGDHRLGLFEWSAEEGADPTDLDALAQANPNLGRRIDPEALMGKAIRAKAAGGEQEAKFRTEVMCQSVKSLVPPKITTDGWDSCADVAGVWSGRFVIAFDVSIGSRSAAVAVAGYRDDGLPQLEVIRSDTGTAWLAEFVALIAAQHGGATAVLANDYPTCRAVFPELARSGIEVTPVSATDFSAACGWLERAVKDGEVRHLADPVLTVALDGAATADVGDGGWRWTRKRSDVDIAPLVAVTVAGHGLRTVPTESAPMFLAI